MPSYRRIARGAGYACLVVIVATSLLPARQMPRTGIPDWGEHFIAYAGTAFLFALILRRRIGRLAALVAALCLLAGAMEILQLLSPGRDTSLADFVAGSAGAAFGAALAMLAVRAIRPPC
ncbi:conserved hypothetical protein [Ancylobacter novellus DSM 506]|uniref:VanZ-like domain-containing protein n=1 Tax=Ancylobacter novellus (strain ATCC 8093 / DSM 506 / JCM 20403 / CCM 1077 / IAM 12100 / NBRC 12443 / NCIMB 10456) TaxID=639283 RepID=D7AAN5_ANCN5|nr:VanZ family protein [Ancylobacter novellus]ADH90902.1 conserved hypothetical protein [Ancylobacter novellus DSM 506]